MIDILIILVYFAVIMLVGFLSRSSDDTTAEEYFISSRSLKWPSIALSTIATNIHAGHFLGMAGSAYLYGLDQANLEINAVCGILKATFVFVPLYLNMKVVTITQFFEKKFGSRVATASLIWIPASIALMAGGHLAQGIGLAVFCGLIVGSIDNVLRPKLVGKDTEMPDLLILLSTLGGIMMFGILGFIIGPIVAALFVAVWEIYGVVFQDLLPKGRYAPGAAETDDEGH